MANNLIRSQRQAVAATGGDDGGAATAILEFQSPTLALVNAPVSFGTRLTTWILASMVVAMFVVFAVVPIDRVVATTGVILAQSPNVIVQPLETAIVRKIYVKEGQSVKKGDLLAELDPTFAASDQEAAAAQMASLKAQVERMRAELNDKPYFSDGSPYGQLEEMAYLQRHQQYVNTLEDYDQKIKSLEAKAQSAEADVVHQAARVAGLRSIEGMRNELEHLQVGSKLNTAQARIDRETGEQNLEEAKHNVEVTKRDLGAMIAERDSWRNQWHGDLQNIAAQQERQLSDMQGQAAKSAKRRELVEMRAETDSIVLNVSRVAPGTVLQTGVELMTTVAADAPLEVAALVDGADAGFIKPGDQARIKFDTLPYFRYGYAIGHVIRISADSFTDPLQGQSNPQGTLPSLSANSPQNTGAAPIYFYRASIAIDQLDLRNPPESFRMKPGLPLQVDINVGRHTILQYLIDRVVPFLAAGGREPT